MSLIITPSALCSRSISAKALKCFRVIYLSLPMSPLITSAHLEQMSLGLLSLYMIFLQAIFIHLNCLIFSSILHIVSKYIKLWVILVYKAPLPIYSALYVPLILFRKNRGSIEKLIYKGDAFIH